MDVIEVLYHAFVVLFTWISGMVLELRNFKRGMQQVSSSHHLDAIGLIRWELVSGRLCLSTGLSSNPFQSSMMLLFLASFQV